MIEMWFEIGKVDAQADRRVSRAWEYRSRHVQSFPSSCRVAEPVMSDTDEWTKLLHEHPIFSLHNEIDLFKPNALELSTKTLPNFTTPDPQNDVPTPSGRRQVMILKDADIIVAAGREIRMSSFGDLKLSCSMRKSYKVGFLTLQSETTKSGISFRYYTHRIFSLKYIRLPSTPVENFSQ